MPIAACRRRRRRDRIICISKPARVTPKELISDIKQGFYVTDLIGSGVNGVTGDYSRGASGFWIENGEITYPVSEVTIAGHLLPMFKSLVAGQRSGIPLRRQCADAAHRGTDAWRTLIRPSSACVARDAALLTDTVREAGALALSLFRTELKNWTKGASSPVSEADIAVNDLVESRLRSATPDYGWLSEESVDDDARLGKPLVWIVDPIDGTRAYLAGREDWCVERGAGRGCDAGAGGGVRAGHATNFSSPCAGRAPRATSGRCVRPRQPSWIFPAWPVRSRWSTAEPVTG